MPRLNGRIPKYRRHKVSGQAIVTLDRRDHYLGPHGTEISRAEYDRLVTEWLANGRRSPAAAAPTDAPAAPTDAPAATSVTHVIHGFWEFAQVHYRKPDGTPTSELDNYRQALRPLRRLYGHTAASEFGPKALKALREHMITLGWCRTNINNHVSRIKGVFRWAVENELVPAAAHHGLTAVRGLRRGRSTAREPEPVRPVPDYLVEAVRPHISKQAWALIRLQLLTGARPGELVKLRPVDLNTGSEIWTTEPDEHKTAHHGHAKRIYFGPQAQEVLKEFLDGRAVDACLFSPAEAEETRRAALTAARTTPLSCGNRPGTNVRQKPSRVPDAAYTVDSYRRAIERACDQAFPPPEALDRHLVKGAKAKASRWETRAEWRHRLRPEKWGELSAWRKAHRWHPHQLRHNAATYIRKEFGIEVARVILGHRSASVTEIYAELDDAKAKTIMQRIG